MLIRDAISKLGYEEDQHQDLAIARIKGGRIVQSTLAGCHERALDVLGDVYVATGAFRKGSIEPFAGRTRENAVRVYDLAFDLDLHDWLGCAKEEAHRLPEGVLETELRNLFADGCELLFAVRVPWTLAISTGYGLLFLSRVVTPDQIRVQDAADLNAHLVTLVNETFGNKIADPRVKDAGTRLIRLPGSSNHKNPDSPRPVEILEERDDLLHLDDFDFEKRPSLPPRRIIPDHAAQLSEDEERKIVLAVAEHWDEGVRHGLSLGLSAMLGKANVPREQARRIVAACAADDAEMRDRIKAVDTTYDRIEKGLSASGYYGLRELLPRPTLDFVDRILEPRFRAQSLPIDVDFVTASAGDGDPRRRPRFAPLPDEAVHGWFRRYLELMRPTTNAPDAFLLGAALVYAGAWIGRRASSYNGEDLFPNLFAILVGRTGKSRKTTAVNRAHRFFGQEYDLATAAGTPYRTLSGITSGEGIVDHLIEFPNTILAPGEFSTMMRRARRSSTGSLVPQLLDLWDCPQSVQIARAQNIKQADFPFASLVATATPPTLAEDMSEGDIGSGFSNRVLWFYGEPGPHIVNPPRVDEGEARWLFRQFKESVEGYKGAPLSMTREAGAFWDSWDEEEGNRVYGNEHEEEMASRKGANAQKLATIYACADGAAQIDEPAIRAAAALVEWQFGEVAKHAPTWGVNADAKVGIQIETLLYERGPMRVGAMKHALGSRIDHGLFARAIKAMEDNQVIADTTGRREYALVEYC